MSLSIEKQIDYALFLASGQDDPHSVTITELCASLSRLRAENERLTAELKTASQLAYHNNARALAAEARAEEAVEDMRAALHLAREDIEAWMKSFPNALHDPSIRAIAATEAALASLPKESANV